ncbi:agmatine deiminase family protein [Pseudidiomarina halophila]|uniref:agmatine deiminase family protein n=1 Tax=Pseudidiomarina halophila TaxID=1449799 RepID=UPI003619D6E1
MGPRCRALYLTAKRHGVGQATGPLYANAGQFNGWQGVNLAHARDQRFARELASRQRIVYRQLELVFEGGMLTHDGGGTAVIHGRSLQARNPGKRLAEMARLLTQKLGLQRVICLQNALGADETGGHVDNQLQFVADDAIVFSTSASDPLWNDEVSALQQQAWASDYRWIELPAAQQLREPITIYQDVVRHSGALVRGARPLLLSYANLVRLPNALVVPQFGVSEDAEATSKLRQAFPELRIIAVNVTEFVRGGGGPHCLTALLPKPLTNLL